MVFLDTEISINVIRLSKDFQELIDIFNRYYVKYLVIGAYSMSNYGYIRTTGDLDIWVEPNRENGVKLVKSLQEFGYDFGTDLAEEISQPDKRLVIGWPPSQIDIMTSIDGISFADAYKNKNEITYKNNYLNIISLEDLIRNKESTGRLKDKADVEELRKRNSRSK